MNYIVKVNADKHSSGGYLSLRQIREGIYLRFISSGSDACKAIVFSSIKEAQEAIDDYIFRDPDYEAADFIIEKMS